MSLIVQKLRLQRGWSQQQLAELSGLSARTVQRIEGGQNATAESLKSLAAVFEVDFQELRTAIDEPPAAPSEGVPLTHPVAPETSMSPQPHLASPAAAPAAPVRSLPDDEVRAFKEVKQLRGFYTHLMKYVLVCSALAILNLWTQPDNLWVLWVVLGWGIGIVSHGLSIWRQDLLLGPQWERRQIEKRLGRKL